MPDPPGGKVVNILVRFLTAGSKVGHEATLVGGETLPPDVADDPR